MKRHSQSPTPSPYPEGHAWDTVALGDGMEDHLRLLAANLPTTLFEVVCEARSICILVKADSEKVAMKRAKKSWSRSGQPWGKGWKCYLSTNLSLGL